MAWRLGDQVIRGELYNNHNYSTHGWIQLRGQESPLHLNLTGNPSPDLRGKQLRFEARDAEAREQLPADEAGAHPNHVAWQQVGPTGEMTSDRMVKTFEGSVEEMYFRTKLGEPPPFEWKRCLYLEWYSQNGRVVIELVDPVLEFFESKPGGEETTEEPPPVTERDEPSGGAGLGISMVEIDDNGDASVQDFSFREATDGEDPDDNDDDPYGLFPNSLEREFEAQARETDMSLDPDGEPSEVIREMELMDDLIERGEGELIGSLFDSPLKLARPEQLSEEQIEPALKSLLAELAILGIAIDVCEHYSPRDTYRLLLETICKEERAYPELRNTQWVQHFCTYDFCEKCDEEFEERNMNRPQGDAGGDERDGLAEGYEAGDSDS